MTSLSYHLSKGTLFTGSILLELLNLALSLMHAPPLLRVAVSLPALFMLPGILLIVIFKGSALNAQLLAVEGFFLSTINAVVITAVLLSLGLPITSLTYSLIAFLLVSILAVICLVKKIGLDLEEIDFLLLGSAFTCYILLLLYFSGIPRFFTPDETGYIFSARMGILQGIVPPIIGHPDTSLLVSSVQGRYFWIYLLISFIVSSGLLPKEAGLLGVGFVMMTALASSLFVKSRWSSRAVFLLVVSSPIILVFSASTLNDLAVAFYATIAGFFLVQSVSKVQGQVSLDAVSLILSFIASFVAALLKLNPVILLATWIISVFVILRYSLYAKSRLYRLLSIILILPVLLYELILDVPYFIFYDVLQNLALGNMFGRLMIFRISPIENLAELLVPLWWNPNAKTLLTMSSTKYVDYFYRLLMPESLSLIISSVVLAIPILLLSKINRNDFRRTILGALVAISILLFYVETIRFEFLNDVARYAIVIVPLSIPLALMILDELKDRPTLGGLLPLFLSALLLIWANVWLSIQSGGIYVGYGTSIPRTQTIDLMMFQLILLMAILSLPFLARKLRLAQGALLKVIRSRPIPSKERIMFFLTVILILFNGIYFSTAAIGNSQMYENRDFSSMANTIQSLSENNTLVFANNYIQLRPYVNDQMLMQGFLLPPPATNGEFQNLLQTAPNGSLILLSNDTPTTYYEYGSSYLAQYFNSNAIVAGRPDVPKLPRMNLTQPFLSMTFDNANSSTIVDGSGSGNNGANHGATVVSGYYGNALNFSNSAYVTVQANDNQNVQNQISISFIAKIGTTDSAGHMILSKGYASLNGSFDVFVWNKTLYFELGGVGATSIPVTPYVGSWHQFIFNYDGNTMSMFVDGIVRKSIRANGFVRPSSYSFEIGRDSERLTYYFVGTIDELQISNRPIDDVEFASSYFTHYAAEIEQYSQGDVFANIYRIINQKAHDFKGGMNVEYATTSIDSNLTITIDVHVHSASMSNVTIIVGTDRFTRVYGAEVNVGENDMQYQFYYVPVTGGPYWPYFYQERVIVIDNIGNIIYNEFSIFGRQDTGQIGRLMFLWSASILWCASVILRFTFISYRRTAHGVKSF